METTTMEEIRAIRKARERYLVSYIKWKHITDITLLLENVIQRSTGNCDKDTRYNIHTSSVDTSLSHLPNIIFEDTIVEESSKFNPAKLRTLTSRLSRSLNERFRRYCILTDDELKLAETIVKWLGALEEHYRTIMDENYYAVNQMYNIEELTPLVQIYRNALHSVYAGGPGEVCVTSVNGSEADVGRVYVKNFGKYTEQTLKIIEEYTVVRLLASLYQLLHVVYLSDEIPDTVT